MSGRLVKHVRRILGEARRAAGACGITITLVSGEGKHAKLVFEGNGRRRIKPLCSTPRSADASVRLALADIRRILREMAG